MAGLVAGVELLVPVLAVPGLVLCRWVQPRKIGLPLGETPQLNGRNGRPWKVGLGLGAVARRRD